MVANVSLCLRSGYVSVIFLQLLQWAGPEGGSACNVASVPARRSGPCNKRDGLRHPFLVLFSLSLALDIHSRRLAGCQHTRSDRYTQGQSLMHVNITVMK